MERLAQVKEIIDQIKTDLSALKELLKQVEKHQSLGELLPPQLAQDVATAMTMYLEHESRLEPVRQQVNLKNNNSLAAWDAYIIECERQHSELSLRSMVIDYFRLSAEAENVKEALIQSKAKLKECCALPVGEVIDALEPYCQVVKHAREPQELLSSEAYDIILSRLGTTIVRASDHNKLRIQTQLDISAYMDGSCALLSINEPEEEEKTPHEQAAKTTTETPPEQTISPNAVVDEPIEPLWDSFDGYIHDTNVEIIDDVPSNQLKTSKYINRTRDKPDIPSTMAYVARRKVVPIQCINSGDSVPSPEMMSFLKSHGYLAIAQYTNGGVTEQAYILSSKGCACFGRPDIVKRNRQIGLSANVHKMEIVPPARITASVILQNELMNRFMEAFSDVRPECRWFVYLSKDHTDNLIGMLVDEDSECMYILFAARFVAGREQHGLDAIRSMAQALDSEPVLILICSLEDINKLSNALSLEGKALARVMYTCIDDVTVWYNGQGKIVRRFSETPDNDPDDNYDGLLDEDALSDDSDRLFDEQKDNEVAGKETDEQAVPWDAEKDEYGVGEESTKDAEDRSEHFIGIADKAYTMHRADVGNVMLLSLSKEMPSLIERYTQYAFATGDPMLREDCRCSHIQTHFPSACGTDIAYDALALAAYLRMYFSDAVSVESFLATQTSLMQDNAVYTVAPSCKSIIFSLKQCVTLLRTGLDDELLNRVIKGYSVKDEIAQCQQSARELLNNGRLVESQHMHRQIKKMRHILFGSESWIRRLLNAIRDDDHTVINRANEQMKPYIDGNAPGDVIALRQKAIDELIDESWQEAYQGVHQRNDRLKGMERNTLTRQLSTVFTLVAVWLSLASGKAEHRIEQLSKLNPILDKLRADMADSEMKLSSVLETSANTHKSACLTILRDTIIELSARLHTGPIVLRTKKFYINLLKTPYISLDEDYLPHMECDEELVLPYDLCERAELCLQSPDLTWEQVIHRIYKADDELERYDYGCASLLRQYLSEAEPSFVWPSGYSPEKDTQLTRNTAAIELDFQAAIEMASGEEQINDHNDRIRIEHAIGLQKSYYTSRHDYGFYIRAMHRTIEKIRTRADHKQTRYLDRLARLKDEKVDDLPIFEQINELILKNQFGAAQSYLQQAENGMTSLSGFSMKDSVFADFLSKYLDNYRAAMVSDKGSLTDAFRSRHPGRHNATIDSGEALLKDWPQSGNWGPERIDRLLRNMDLPVNRVRTYNSGTYSITFEKPGNELNYQHPIAAFGTSMRSSGLDVVVILGNKDARQLNADIRKIITASRTTPVLFLVNCAISITDRRHLASIIKHENQNLTPYLIMDRVMALYIVDTPKNERWNTLLKCALPFQALNPYSENYALEIPPEMFIGRRKELSTIIDPKGANLIYGGRQLGKTALLRRAVSLRHNPDHQAWAVYVDIKKTTIQIATERIFNELRQYKFFKEDCKLETWEDLTQAIESRIRNDHTGDTSLLLLIDEADAFLTECKASRYKELDALKRVQASTSNRFKFVLAGLHDVLRFHKDAYKANSVLPQLGGFSIKPLDYPDACELLEKPLTYLGFTLQDNQMDIVAQILSFTNFFPGLIHFYASRLISSLSRGRSTIGGDIPPYPLDRQQLLLLLKDQDFLDSRLTRLQMTLEVDSDEHQYYNILAHIMCYCFNNEEDDAVNGLTVGRIIQECEQLDIRPITKLTDKQVATLLDELVDLNILRVERRDGEPHYLFSRSSFQSMLGTKEQVENKLYNYIGEGSIDE